MGNFCKKAAICAIALAAPALAGINGHSGANDPNNEGFDPIVVGASTAEGPIINDNGSGFDAWSLSKAIDATEKGYEYILTNGEAQEANTVGWFVKARIRIAMDNDNPDYAVAVMYSNGDRRFDMVLGSTIVGDPIVKLVDSFTADGVDPQGSTFTYTGGGNGYHLYEMRWDPAAQGVDLFIDGTERMSDYLGQSTFVPTPRLDFGCFGLQGTGDGHYNSVDVFLAPEPGAGLVVLCGAMLVGKRRRNLL